MGPQTLSLLQSTISVHTPSSGHQNVVLSMPERLAAELTGQSIPELKQELAWSFAMSYASNLRNHEHHWYAAWEQELKDLVSDCPTILVSSQFPLQYDSLSEEQSLADPPSSLTGAKGRGSGRKQGRTKATKRGKGTRRNGGQRSSTPPEATREAKTSSLSASSGKTEPIHGPRGPVTDFALIHVYAFTTSSPRFGGVRYKIGAMTVNMLIELKRSGSRRSRGWLLQKDLNDNLDDAKQHLVRQAAALFTVNAGQTSVSCIAVAGTYWTCMTLTTDHPQVGERMKLIEEERKIPVGKSGADARRQLLKTFMKKPIYQPRVSDDNHLSPLPADIPPSQLVEPMDVEDYGERNEEGGFAVPEHLDSNMSSPILPVGKLLIPGAPDFDRDVLSWFGPHDHSRTRGRVPEEAEAGTSPPHPYFPFEEHHNQDHGDAYITDADESRHDDPDTAGDPQDSDDGPDTDDIEDDEDYPDVVPNKKSDGWPDAIRLNCLTSDVRLAALREEMEALSRRELPGAADMASDTDEEMYE